MNDTQESGSAERGLRKAELVCPTCGRTAPVDGDWSVTERVVEGRIEMAYECPECSTVLVSQPTFECSKRAHPA